MMEAQEKAAEPIGDGGGVSREASARRLTELVVCSLEPWDDVWRRNQFFTNALLRRNPRLRVLFVEPPADVLFDLAQRRRPSLPHLRKLTGDGRLTAFRPLKPLPRRFGRLADAVLMKQVQVAARTLGFARPTLWINDVTYAPLIARTGLPSLYDVTDDWLLADVRPREHARLKRLDELALQQANEVVVCSSALAASRGAARKVSLVPNGVDLDHFRRPQTRPSDLPPPPVAVYVGSLHDARIDVELVANLARSLPDLVVTLVGPDSLLDNSRELLSGIPNVKLLGPRPYAEVPGYLQHADIIIIPHRVSPFTESLDPIKAYECLAVLTPTIATPAAGFRDQAGLSIVDRASFVDRVAAVLELGGPRVERSEPIDWRARAEAFENVISRCDRSYGRCRTT